MDSVKQDSIDQGAMSRFMKILMPATSCAAINRNTQTGRQQLPARSSLIRLPNPNSSSSSVSTSTSNISSDDTNYQLSQRTCIEHAVARARNRTRPQHCSRTAPQRSIARHAEPTAPATTIAHIHPHRPRCRYHPVPRRRVRASAQSTRTAAPAAVQHEQKRERGVPLSQGSGAARRRTG